MSMGDKVQCTFVSEKVNKVRWKPQDYSSAFSEYFITGSWDDEICHLTLRSFPINNDDPDELPVKCRIKHNGDVTELKFVNSSSFVVSSSNGTVKRMEIDVKYPQCADIKELVSWNNIHHLANGHSCSCTSLACFEEDIATVGEDGRINLLTARQEKPVHVIDDADSSSLQCVCFLKHNELLTGNLRGLMKVWDFKNSNQKPAMSFMLSNDQVAATCVTHHPTQRHMVLAGGEDGSLTVWDLRHNVFPISVLNAHTDSVTELHFHPDRPEHVFSCSADGEVWHWKTDSASQTSRFANISDVSFEENPWLTMSGDASKHRMQILTLMSQLHKPINSLDINKSRIVCGCDNEAVYVFKNVNLY